MLAMQEFLRVKHTLPRSSWELLLIFLGMFSSYVLSNEKYLCGRPCPRFLAAIADNEARQVFLSASVSLEHNKSYFENASHVEIRGIARTKIHRSWKCKTLSSWNRSFSLGHPALSTPSENNEWFQGRMKGMSSRRKRALPPSLLWLISFQCLVWPWC